MAHKKGQGSTRNGRDSNPQFRGIKYYGGEVVRAGATIIRQCGTKFKAGYLVKRANDDGLYAITDGTVQFRGRFVDIIPADPAIPHYAAGRNGNGDGNANTMGKPSRKREKAPVA